jgi:hypothetical protein
MGDKLDKDLVREFGFARTTLPLSA